MFEHFPKISYDIDRDGSRLLVTNIMRRFALREKLRTRALLFYDYAIKDGERPDVVAHKFYGDHKLDWLILITNQIIDPHFDWFMGYYDFKNYIISKYGSIETAQTTVNHYEWIIQATTEQWNDPTIRERVIIVDTETYAGLPESDRKIVYDYDYESALNEDRRNIRLLKEDFLPQILSEVETIFNGS